MNNLLKNGIVSISLGVDDYLSKESDRIISSVRNVYSGILLIFKAKLLEMSPKDSNEVLIKTKIIPIIKDNQIIFIGDGKMTVDHFEIQKRFNSLGISIDWKLFEKIQQERNNLEHYYSSNPRNIVESLLVDAFKIITDYIKNVLEENPADLLGETWGKLLNIKDIYDSEKRECEKKIKELLNFNNLQMEILSKLKCSKCKSDLLYPIFPSEEMTEVLMICSKCNNEIKLSNEVERIIEKMYDYDAYTRIKEGGESVIGTCPQCGKETYNKEEDICLNCQYTREYTECIRCGAELSLDEQDLDGLCFYCDHQLSKIMEEN
jgi:hypothetical protein